MSKSENFSIETIETSSLGDVSTAEVDYFGKIVVGDFLEEFRMDLTFWGVADYRASWIKSLQKLFEADLAVSCLLSSVVDPEVANFIFCWPLYRIGQDVYVQNSVIFLDELDSKFDIDEPWKSVNPRSTVDDEGNEISEWTVSLSVVEEFLDRQMCA